LRRGRDLDALARRDLVTFDPDYFKKEAAEGRVTDPVNAFRHAYRENHWQGSSRSGPGSTPDQTATIVREIPDLLAKLGVRRFLDLPCGDFSWMANADLQGVSYIGGDLVPEVVANNTARYSRENRTFLTLDVVSDPLPDADLILCRDCLVHLSLNHSAAALRNIADSGIIYLLATTFPEEPNNSDIVTGDWRPLDLTAAPFNLPAPLELLNEGCSEQEGAFSDKSLGLWRVADVATAMSI